MGKLTTHVLDTANGCAAAGVAISLYRLQPQRQLIAEGTTNSDGRLDQPLLEQQDFLPGTYELIFKAGDYFRRLDLQLPDPPFIDEVPLRFGIANSDQHYHVPLLVSPWSYSTYRGS